MARPKFAQLAKTFLKSPIVPTETGTIVLDAIKDIYGNNVPIATLGGRLRCTFSSGNTDEEIIYCTGYTVSADGSYVTLDTGIVRAQQAVYPYTGSGIAQAHSAGTQVVLLPDNPHLFEEVLLYIDGIALASAVPATDTTVGYTKLTESQNAPRAMASLVSEQGTPGLTLHVQPFSISVLSTIVSYAGGNTGTFTAPVSNPRIDLIVYSTTSSAIVIRGGTEAGSPTEPTPSSGDIVLASVYLKVGTTALYERDDSVSTHGYIKRWYYPSVFDVAALPAGTISPYAGRAIPSGWLLSDGSAVLRTTYAALFANICPSQTFTVTQASPAVFTATAHSLVAGDKIHLTTTGGLLSGLATNTDYYIISAGLTANAFEVALSPGGAAVNTTGSQSGVHTLYASAFGKGDGSSTFNLPDLGSRIPVGLSATAPATQTLSFEPTAVSTGSDNVTILNTVFPSQGQKIQLTTTGTLPAGLSLATDYYIVRSSTTTIQFSTTQANANAASPVVVNITDQGSGVHTMTFTNLAHTVRGRMGGEETHGISIPELAAHTHSLPVTTGSGLGGGGAVAVVNTGTTGSSGSDSQHNNMMPFLVVKYLIKT